jgi:hypothetical protein
MALSRARLWLCSAAALVLASWNPLPAQPGKKKSSGADSSDLPQISVAGLWKTNDGLIVRLHQAGNRVQSSFDNSSCQCETGSPRTFYIKGELSWCSRDGSAVKFWSPDEHISLSSAVLQVCTDAGLWKDCHGKGLNPDTEVWETPIAEATCSASKGKDHGKVVECTSIEGTYLGQYYQKKLDDKLEKVVNCTRTTDPRNNFSLVRTTGRVPQREPTPPSGRGLDPDNPWGRARPGGWQGFLLDQWDDATGAVQGATKTGEHAVDQVTDPIKNDKGYKRFLGPENHNQ